MSGGGKATLVAVLLILLIPIPVHSTKENDNSTEYKALLYIFFYIFYTIFYKNLQHFRKCCIIILELW